MATAAGPRGARPAVTRPPRQEPYRRWGIKTAREYAQIKIDGGNPDFTNAPGHGDDDARFYDRQQAYVHARGG